MPRAILASDDGGSGVLPRVPMGVAESESAAESEGVVLRVAAFRVLRRITGQISGDIERVLDRDSRPTEIGFTRRDQSIAEANPFFDSLKRSMQSLESFVSDARFAYPGGYEARLCGVNILGAIEGFYRQMVYAGGHDSSIRADIETQDAAVRLRSAMLGASIKLEALERGYVPQDGLLL